MRRRRAASLAANPVLVGAVTTLVVITAVFLAYNANKGLPFVPSFEMKILTPNAQRLVVGNEVREGGERIGQITQLRPLGSGGRGGAEMTVALDKTVTPLPEDTTAVIRPRSTLGLKYVDLVRGNAPQALRQGDTIRITEESIPPEFDDFFGIFDKPTREDARTNLVTFGDGFAGRGEGLNRALADLPELLGGLVPVMQTLSDKDTNLRGFIGELADAARVTAPVADDLAEGLVAGGDVFEAISRDPDALRETISEGPPTLRSGIRELPVQRPFLARLAAISTDISATAAEVRRSVGPIGEALEQGTEVLPETVELNEDVETSLEALRVLAASPTTNITLEGLDATSATLRPTLRYVGPAVTVCNYFNYFWTYFADHLAEEDATGTLERIQSKQAGGGMTEYGRATPANGEPIPFPLNQVEGDPVNLHAQPYGRAVDEQGNADCENGQRGYPRRLAEGAPPNVNIVVDPRTPGSQGPTFTGKPRVPAGQTFSAEPTGRAPKVAEPVEPTP